MDLPDNLPPEIKQWARWTWGRNRLIALALLILAFGGCAWQITDSITRTIRM